MGAPPPVIAAGTQVDCLVVCDNAVQTTAVTLCDCGAQTSTAHNTAVAVQTETDPCPASDMGVQTDVEVQPEVCNAEAQTEVDRQFSDVSTQVESTEVFECEAQTEAEEPLVMEYFVVADQPGFSLEDSFLEDDATQ